MLKKILIDEIKAGMVFKSGLMTEDNKIIIKAGIEIRESDYNKIVRWGLKELYTEDEEASNKTDINSFHESEILNEPDNVSDQILQYKKIYNNCIILFNECISEFKQSEKLDKQKLVFIIKKILGLIYEYKNEILSYISINIKDYDYISTHSVNTAIISIIGAKELKLSDMEIENLGVSSLLHDIGMIKIPSDILNKKDKLTDDEFNSIKSHPITAFKQISKSEQFEQSILDAVLHHHEQYNGNGYPRKLSGDKISLFARILAVSDTYEAQITYRSYRKTKTSYSAIKSVLAEASNKFDPVVLRAFLNAFSIYPPGTIVQLNDNSIGSVISINNEAPLRPVLKIFIDKFGDRVLEKTLIDLRNEDDFFIVKVIDKDEYQK